jgi:hypothetical protein
LPVNSARNEESQVKTLRLSTSAYVKKRSPSKVDTWILAEELEKELNLYKKLIQMTPEIRDKKREKE